MNNNLALQPMFRSTKGNAPADKNGDDSAITVT